MAGLGAVGKFVSAQPAFTTFALGTGALAGATAAADGNGKLGGLSMRSASAAVTIGGIGVALLSHRPVSSIGGGMIGAGLVGLIMNRNNAG